MRFAALGRTHWLYESIQAAVEAGHEPVCIASAPGAPEYRVQEPDFEALADRLEVPYLSSSDGYAAILDAARDAEVGLSVNWPSLLPGRVLSAFSHGVLNAHAGDLPRFRGNACPNWAIIAGEGQMGLVIHRMVKGLDAGPVLVRRYCPIGPATYIGDLYNFMDQEIPPMMVEALDGLANGTLTGEEQSEDPLRMMRCLPRRPEDGFLDWARPAQDLERLVRASSRPFAGAFTFLEGHRLIVWRAFPEDPPHALLGRPGQVVSVHPAEGLVRALTGKGLLVLEEVQVEGEPATRPADLIRSTRTRLGEDPGAAALSLLARVRELERQRQETRPSPPEV